MDIRTYSRYGSTYSRYGSIGRNEYKTDSVVYGTQIRPASHLCNEM